MYRGSLRKDKKKLPKPKIGHESFTCVPEAGLEPARPLLVIGF
jgi:hypothetical protein